MAKKRKSRALVIGYLERIASKAFEGFPKQVTELIGKKHGIYALYKGDRLYYVGLATNLRNRIKHHLKDRHAGKWDRFSLYLVRKTDHIKELESLLLRIAGPKGNLTGGKLKRAENLKTTLKQKIKQEQGRQIDKLMGTKSKTSSKSRKKSSAKEKSQPSLAPYVKKRMKIRREYKGKLYVASVRSNGTINYKGNVYNSPSMAGKAITKRSTAGWHFWRYKNKKGEWVRLNELRKK